MPGYPRDRVSDEADGMPNSQAQRVRPTCDPEKFLLYPRPNSGALLKLSGNRSRHLYGIDFLSVCQLLQVATSLPHEHLGHLLIEQRYLSLFSPRFLHCEPTAPPISDVSIAIVLQQRQARCANLCTSDEERGALNNHGTEHTMCTVSRA